MDAVNWRRRPPLRLRVTKVIRWGPDGREFEVIAAVKTVTAACGP
jgi:hypothetical protein